MNVNNIGPNGKHAVGTPQSTGVIHSDEAKKAEVQSKDVTLTYSDADQILSAMNIASTFARQQHGLNNIDPSKYLSPERIADIQASMGVFEEGVAGQLKMLENEFGFLTEYSDLSSADKLEMAAKAYVHEAEKDAA